MHSNIQQPDEASVNDGRRQEGNFTFIKCSVSQQPNTNISGQDLLIDQFSKITAKFNGW